MIVSIVLITLFCCWFYTKTGNILTNYLEIRNVLVLIVKREQSMLAASATLHDSIMMSFWIVGI